jgi:hypothetical protein
MLEVFCCVQNVELYLFECDVEKDLQCMHDL